MERVSIHSLDGVLLASQTELGPGAAFSFEASRKNAYLLMAQAAGGVKLWAISPQVVENTVQDVDLRSTNEAALILASLGGSLPQAHEVDGLKLNAGRPLIRMLTV